MRESKYKGYLISLNRIDSLWYGYDPARHIKETRIRTKTYQGMLAAIDKVAGDYKTPVFGWMAV